MRGAAAAAVCFLGGLVARASAQIQVMAPGNLVAQFNTTYGRVDGSTATFGAPFYGDRVLGRLVYGETAGDHHCSDKDYSVPPAPTFDDDGDGEDQARLINIVVVRRGKCSFVHKVQVAQDHKEAHAVIIVDEAKNGLSRDDIQKIIVADDGWGANVHIPSVLISNQDGEKLIAAAKAKSGDIVVELAWDIPTERVVTLDIWLSSGSTESLQFLKNFADAREHLNEVIKFYPHYHIFKLDPVTGGYNDLCLDSTAEYCAEDPDKSGPITGRDVLDEDVRQLCIHELTRVPRRHAAIGQTVFFAKEWWDYVKLLPERCPIPAKGEDLADDRKFGVKCSEALMDEVSIDKEKVSDCVGGTREQKLQEQRRQTAWSPRAIRVNGWRFNGMLEADLVTRAVCSAFVVQPTECEDLLTYRDPTAKYSGKPQSNGISIGTLLFCLIGLTALGFCAMALYKRFLDKNIHRTIREEVMVEVNEQMSSYSKLPANM